MAFAGIYDIFEDAGMAFSDTELKDWNPKEWMTKYVENLAGQLAVWRRRGELPGMSHPWATAEVIKKLWEKVTWDCTTAIGIPVNEVLGVKHINEAELPASNTPDGKALNKRALDIEPMDWLAARQEYVRTSLIYVVTVWRRQPSVGKKVPKADRSYANKFVHCLNRELLALNAIIHEMEKHPSKNVEEKVPAD